MEGREDAGANGADVLPIRPEPVEAFEIIVPPSAVPTVLHVERYAAADRAAAMALPGVQRVEFDGRTAVVRAVQDPAASIGPGAGVSLGVAGAGR